MLHLGSQALEVRSCFGGLGGRRENRLGIGLQKRQPLREILRVVGPRFLRDLQLCAQERCADFSHELLGGIGLIAEALAEFTVKPVFRTRPVCQLVNERGVVSSLRDIVAVPQNASSEGIWI